MVKQYIHPKFMNNPQTAVVGEVIVFGTPEILATVKDLDDMVADHSLCSHLDIREQRIYVPLFETAVLVGGVVNVLGHALENGNNVRPLISNYIVAEMLDPDAQRANGSVNKESIEQLVDGCEILLNQIIKVYDITHSRDDGRHDYELLKLANSGTLIVCRFCTCY